MATILDRRGLCQALEGLTPDELMVANPFLRIVSAAAKSGSLYHADPEIFCRSFENSVWNLPEPEIIALGEIELPDRSTPLVDRICAGEYEIQSDRITSEFFPVIRNSGSWSYVLVCFGVDIFCRDEVVWTWAKERGYAVTLIEELLALGASSRHQYLRRKFPIVPLGTFVILHGRRCIPFIDGSNTKWDLRLGEGMGWRRDCYFMLRRIE